MSHDHRGEPCAHHADHRRRTTNALRLATTAIPAGEARVHVLALLDHIGDRMRAARQS